MILLAKAAFIIALAQPATEPTVVVILHPDQSFVTMTVTEAEQVRLTTTDPKLRAAIDWALGTRPQTTPRLESWDRERERFQRQPLNGKLFGGDP